MTAEAPDQDCPTCCGTGEVPADEDDGEGHTARGVASAPCPDCAPEATDYEETDDE